MNRPSPGPGCVPVPQVAARVWRIPDSGKETCRFLGPVDGMYIHWHGKRGHACRGEEHCPTQLHKLAYIWQGFAAGEYWSDQTRLWTMAVLQVTDRWWEKLAGQNLRGQTWRVWRVLNEFTKEETDGELVDLVEPNLLRPSFSAKDVVARVYGATDIVWGRKPVLPPRQLFAPAPDLPPPTASPQTPAHQIEGTAEYEAELAKTRAMLRARGGMRALEASANGKAGKE